MVKLSSINPGTLLSSSGFGRRSSDQRWREPGAGLQLMGLMRRPAVAALDLPRRDLIGAVRVRKNAFRTPLPARLTTTAPEFWTGSDVERRWEPAHEEVRLPAHQHARRVFLVFGRTVYNCRNTSQYAKQHHIRADFAHPRDALAKIACYRAKRRLRVAAARPRCGQPPVRADRRDLGYTPPSFNAFDR